MKTNYFHKWKMKNKDQ